MPEVFIIVSVLAAALGLALLISVPRASQRPRVPARWPRTTRIRDFHLQCRNLLHDRYGVRIRKVRRIAEDTVELRRRNPRLIAHCVFRAETELVGVQYLKNLQQAIARQGADRGILITNGSFEPAVSAAADETVVLIPGVELRGAAPELQISPRNRELEAQHHMVA